jgi:peptidyl-prolyl cis-trans isomerase B (cyclophilin B)
MNGKIGIPGFLVLLAALSVAGFSCNKHNPVVVVDTSMGTIKIELDAAKAPKSTANFLKYVDEGFYDGTIFHRVIGNFMIQGGGFTPDMKEKAVHEPVVNEAGNGLKNVRGTVAMARTDIVNSATSQFFINVADNAFLDHKDDTKEGFGYTVFGKVIEGMDVVDKIKTVRTTVSPSSPNESSVPVEPVMVKSVKRQ